MGSWKTSNAIYGVRNPLRLPHDFVVKNYNSKLNSLRIKEELIYESNYTLQCSNSATFAFSEIEELIGLPDRSRTQNRYPLRPGIDSQCLPKNEQLPKTWTSKKKRASENIRAVLSTQRDSGEILLYFVLVPFQLGVTLLCHDDLMPRWPLWFGVTLFMPRWPSQIGVTRSRSDDIYTVWLALWRASDAACPAAPGATRNPSEYLRISEWMGKE